MLLGLVSAKGAPGVSTAALALTAAAGDGALLVELDPSGGSVECWTGVTGEPGLIGLVSGLRRSARSETLLAHVVDSPPGVRSILAPTAGGLAEASISMAGDRLVPALADLDATVIADMGRWSSSQSTACRLTGCDAVGVVCAPTVDGIESARWLLEPLVQAFGDRVAVVLVGDRPYRRGEVEAALDVRVLGDLAWDPRGVNALLTAGAGRGWSRSALARSAASVLRDLRHASRHDSEEAGRA